eukprot:976797-Alexandrium_andersonii.AAC.1
MAPPGGGNSRPFAAKKNILSGAKRGLSGATNVALGTLFTQAGIEHVPLGSVGKRGKDSEPADPD